MASPQSLYTVAQVRAFDAAAISAPGMSTSILMERAGAAAFAVLRAAWPAVTRVGILCGSGNNGGDGYALGRLLRGAGVVVRLQAVAPAAETAPAAQKAAADFLAAGGRIDPFDAGALADCEVLVDGLLGTGARSPLRGAYRQAIETINHSTRAVLALDIPSGLDADTGRVGEVAVRAMHTVCFVAVKAGLLLGEGPDYCGTLHCADLQVRLSAATPVATVLGDNDLEAALPQRPRSAHKGRYGHVLVVGGGAGMGGAARLAAEAGLRAGAGLVTVAAHPDQLPFIVGGRPELMGVAARSAGDLKDVLARSTVVAVGPGLGQNDWAAHLLEAVLASGRPLVIDADALNLLAGPGLRSLPANGVATPHPGEAARLLGCSSAEVQADRLAALRALVTRLGCTVVLKGAGTLIGAPGRVPALCTAGNPGMATAGMGDVLTGAVAGVLAQCGEPWQAACAAVLAHARAGDREAQRVGARGLLALDVAAQLPAALNRHAC